MMPLVKRIAAEKRAIVLPLAIAAVVNILAYAFVVYPLGVNAAGAADRASIALSARRTAEHDEALARALVTGKAKADEELSAFYQKVLPADATAAQRMTYVSLFALARKHHVAYENRKWTDEDKDSTRDTDKGAQLGHLVIHMVLQGEWDNIRAFIYELESSRDFLIIDDVTLLEGKNNEPLSLTVDMSTYYRQRSNGT